MGTSRSSTYGHDSAETGPITDWPNTFPVPRTFSEIVCLVMLIFFFKNKNLHPISDLENISHFFYFKINIE